MKVDVETIVRDLINKTVHMSLATCIDNKPWVCEVHFAYDDSLNLYFVSYQSARHCQEIKKNKFVAGNIIRQHELSEYPAGLYFEGKAQELTDANNEQIDLYCSRQNYDRAKLEEMLREPGGARIYEIVVDNWAIFGKFDGRNNGKKHTLTWNGGKNES